MEWLLAYTLSRTSKVPQLPSFVVFREGEYLKLFSDMGVIRDLEKLRIAFKLDLKYTQWHTSTGTTELTERSQPLDPSHPVQSHTLNILLTRLLVERSHWRRKDWSKTVCTRPSRSFLSKSWLTSAENKVAEERNPQKLRWWENNPHKNHTRWECLSDYTISEKQNHAEERRQYRHHIQDPGSGLSRRQFHEFSSIVFEFGSRKTVFTIGYHLEETMKTNYT